ncbi:hypothetical protein [Kitasatospora sp. NPDC092286]|uniref:hypothetical protein n=1 Tax=Kitasatospora sp. NPDC092286 TaxID=3364087 RepID=UPI00382A67BC
MSSVLSSTFTVGEITAACRAAFVTSSLTLRQEVATSSSSRPQPSRTFLVSRRDALGDRQDLEDVDHRVGGHHSPSLPG